MARSPPVYAPRAHEHTAPTHMHRWPARLPYMPPELMSILHLLTCIDDRSPPAYARRAHEHTTPTHVHRWPARLPYVPLELTSILHLLTCISTRTARCCFTLFHSCFTPALSIIELSFCFIYTPALVLLYSSFVTAVILFY